MTINSAGLCCELLRPFLLMHSSYRSMKYPFKAYLGKDFSLLLFTNRDILSTKRQDATVRKKKTVHV